MLDNIPSLNLIIPFHHILNMCLHDAWKYSRLHSIIVRTYIVCNTSWLGIWRRCKFCQRNIVKIECRCRLSKLEVHRAYVRCQCRKFPNLLFPYCRKHITLLAICWCLSTCRIFVSRSVWCTELNNRIIGICTRIECQTIPLSHFKSLAISKHGIYCNISCTVITCRINNFQAITTRHRVVCSIARLSKFHSCNCLTIFNERPVVSTFISIEKRIRNIIRTLNSTTRTFCKSQN